MTDAQRYELLTFLIFEARSRNDEIFENYWLDVADHVWYKLTFDEREFFNQERVLLWRDIFEKTQLK